MVSGYTKLEMWHFSFLHNFSSSLPLLCYAYLVVVAFIYLPASSKMSCTSSHFHNACLFRGKFAQQEKRSFNCTKFIHLFVRGDNDDPAVYQ